MCSDFLWELARRVAASLRWRPVSRPIFPGCTQSNCGSGLAREAVDLAVAVAVVLAFDFDRDLDLLPLSQRPNAGVAQGAPRQGCRGSRPRPWMADGGGPPEQCRSEGMPSLSEAPNGGAKPFGSFSAFGKGTRCKSETASDRDRRNGYVHHQKSRSAIRPPSRASPLPQGSEWTLREQGQTQARLLLTTSYTSLDSCPEARIRSSSPFINA